MVQVVKENQIPDALRNNLMSYLALAIVNNGSSAYIEIGKATDFLIGTLEEENVRNILGEDYSKLMDAHIAFKIQASVIESYLVGLDRTSIAKENVNSDFFIGYQRAIFKSSVYHPLEAELLAKLLVKTNLKNVDIPAKIFQELKQESKRTDIENDIADEDEQEEY